MIVFSVWLITLAQLPPDAPTPAAEACQDVYDQTIGCPGVDKTPLVHAGEPISPTTSASQPTEPGSALDLNSIGWGFMVGSGITASLALSLQLTSLVYRLRVWELASAGQLSVDTYRDLANAQYYMGIGATCLWFGSALIAGSGASFWIFDPRNGSMRDPFSAE